MKFKPAWVVPDIARAADVAIFTGAEARYNLLFENLLEATLLRSGIPVLLLPESLEAFTPERTLIAWDGDVKLLGVGLSTICLRAA